MIFKKVFVFMLVVTLVPMMGFSATNHDQQPLVKKGADSITVSGSLREWKDIPKISGEEMFANRRMKPVMNFESPRRIVKTAMEKDPVVQTTPGLQRGALATSAPIKNFAGMNLTSNGAGWPPDPNGDVGGDYYIQTVNTSIGIYNKSTGALVSATTFNNFFGGTGITGTPCDAYNNGDPIVLYDQFSQRWFILDFAWSGTSGGSYYAIAVSQTSNPTGAWWQYCLQADTTLMNDYPKCGIWGDGIYITANMFQFSGTYQHAKMWALKKPDIYSGTLTVQSVTDAGTMAWSIMPANARGNTAPPTGAPNYMYSIDASEYGTGHSDALYVWKYTVNWTTPSLTTWTGPSQMPVAAYTIVSTGVPQKGTTKKLDSLYGRLMYPANYRKFSTHEAVYLCHVAESSSTRKMRWYEIRIASGVSSIYQQGTYAPDTHHRWMGSVCADSLGNIALAYSVSSSTLYPSIRYTGRKPTDTLGTMPQGEQILIAGTGYQKTYTRWGDYSSLTVDPADDLTFWYTNEYYITSGTNWQTRIGSFKIL